MTLPGAREHLSSERGFTLPEVMIVIVIMGILFGIATSTWFGVVESRAVDSAANQVASDLRRVHTAATNRLTNHEVRLTAGSPTYQIGPSGALETGTLPDGTVVDVTLVLVFEPDGSASATPAPPSGSPVTFKVRSDDGAPDHDVEVNPATSRVRIVD
jgi:prepilin-type N-terminal cleavage/methylation domain-containing protein